MLPRRYLGTRSYPSDHLGVMAWFTIDMDSPLLPPRPPRGTDTPGTAAFKRWQVPAAQPAPPRTQRQSSQSRVPQGRPKVVLQGRSITAGALWAYQSPEVGAYPIEWAADGKLDTFFWSGRAPRADDLIQLDLEVPFSCGGGDHGSDGNNGVYKARAASTRAHRAHPSSGLHFQHFPASESEGGVDGGVARVW